MKYGVVDLQEMRDSNLVCQFLFCKKSGECCDKSKFTAKNCNSYKNSPLKTANLTKLHRFRRNNCVKMRVLCGENYFFSPLFTAILTLFFYQTLTRAAIHRNSYVIFLPNFFPGLEHQRLGIRAELIMSNHLTGSHLLQAG